VTHQLDQLVELRLLERVGGVGRHVIDAHPLVRRGFEARLGTEGMRENATARAGFLRGRPDRKPPTSLEQAREEVELFSAYCDAGLWNEADSIFVALDNPKRRFLAPAFELSLLLRFFPDADWRQTPLWNGFGRWRSLAICLEMLGQFGDALELYRAVDAPLRGDALIALGKLKPLLAQEHSSAPWHNLWRAYRAHALCLAGRHREAVALAQAVVPVDVYEWVHVFECLLRADKLEVLDLNSMLYRAPAAAQDAWTVLAQRRMRADYVRVTDRAAADTLEPEFRALIEAYDQAGLPFERALTRLSYTRWLLDRKFIDGAWALNQATLTLARQYYMSIVEADALEAAAKLNALLPHQPAPKALEEAQRLRECTGYRSRRP
jgi:hypothetical protein